MTTRHTITLRYEWDMAHRLPHHNGKCQRLHGHRYVALVTFSGAIQRDTQASNTGMILDFDVCKRILSECIEFWDHRTMLHKDDPIAQMPHAASYGVFTTLFMPTAENIALEIFDRTNSQLAIADVTPDVRVTQVRVFETPNSYSDTIEPLYKEPEWEK